MKKVFLMIVGVLVAVMSVAQGWTFDKSHGNLSFTISHLVVSDVDGMFTSFDVKIESKKDDFSDAQIALTAEAATINTDNENRDNHLRSADFFDVKKYPLIKFVSTTVTKEKDNTYTIQGNLTMHGVTKAVTLNALFRGTSTDPYSKKKVAGFKVQGKINRFDFSIGNDTPVAIVGNELTVNANIALIEN